MSHIEQPSRDLPRRARPSIDRPVRWTAVIAILALLALPGLAACGNSSSNTVGDRLWGKVVVAVNSTSEAEAGPQLTVPPGLAARADVTPYRMNNMAGTQMIFREVTFGDFAQIGDMVTGALSADTGGGSMEASARRTGGSVVISGTADLSSYAQGEALLEFSVQFPGPIASSSGEQDGDSSTKWTINGSEQQNLQAEASYTDPSTASFTGWAGLMLGIALAVVVVVGALAYVTRDQSPRMTETSSQ